MQFLLLFDAQCQSMHMLHPMTRLQAVLHLWFSLQG